MARPRAAAILRDLLFVMAVSRLPRSRIDDHGNQPACQLSGAWRLWLERARWNLVDDGAENSLAQGSQRAQRLAELWLGRAAPFHHDEQVIDDLGCVACVDGAGERRQIQNDPLIATFALAVDGTNQIAPHQVEIARFIPAGQKVEVRTNVVQNDVLEGGRAAQQLLETWHL